MEGNSPYITNLVNSIIGVSVLAMPFCLKQCGIVLGLALLFCAAALTYLSCSMLASSAFHKRRRTYEYLALCTLGPTGKFAVELSMIGMMLGTCVAFYVVIGDLSNGILSKFIDGADPHMLRVFTIIFCALCIALPLGMMKNLAVLSYFGFFSLLFYLAFLVVVILNAVSNGLLSLDWWGEVNLFRPAGMFQCLPIFSLAYACQCQLFIVYSSLEEPSVRRIEDIVSGAIKFVTLVYMSVGFFGYTTYREHIAGNLLVSFPSNLLLDFIKLGFAMSVVLGFPLMISPCRQSIHTLFFAKPAGEGIQPQTYIPPFLFKSITLTIVLSTMTIAIVIPNVETILGLTGATMGSIICFIFPALIYEKAAPKGPGAIPKFVFCLGCVLLIICTYSNLASTGRQNELEHPVVPMDQKPPEVDLHEIGKDSDIVNENEVEGKEEKPDPVEDKDKPNNVAEFVGNEHRHEPANPVETDDEEAKQGDKPVKEEAKEEFAAPDGKDAEKNEEKDNPEVRSPQSPKEIEKPAVNDEKVEDKKDDLKKEDSLRQEKVDEKLPVKNPPDEKQGEKISDLAPKIPDQRAHESPRKDENEKLPVGKDSDSIPAGQRISPKIIRNDNDADAKPELKQPEHDLPRPGMQHKQEDLGVHHQFDVPKVDAKNVEDDSPEEKKLLEKIKIQQEQQQKLLIEQDLLIKKLEEHQEKKEQAAEEKHDTALKSDEVRAQRDVRLPASDNVAVGKDSINAPPKDFLGEFKGLDAKVEVPGGKVLAGDGVIAGRELLSNQNENEDVTMESDLDKKLDIDAEERDDDVVALLREGVDQIKMEPQNPVLDHPASPQLEKKGLENADDDEKKVPFQEEEPKRDIIEPKKNQATLDLRRVERSLESEDQDQLLQQLLKETLNAENRSQKESLLGVSEVISLDGKNQELDVGAHQGSDGQHVEGVLLGESHRDPAKFDEDSVKSKDIDTVQDTKISDELVQNASNNRKLVKNGEGLVADCFEEDSNCWQEKTKTRELKSLGIDL